MLVWVVGVVLWFGVVARGAVYGCVWGCVWYCVWLRVGIVCGRAWLHLCVWQNAILHGFARLRVALCFLCVAACA